MNYRRFIDAAGLSNEGYRSHSVLFVPISPLLRWYNNMFSLSLNWISQNSGRFTIESNIRSTYILLNHLSYRFKFDLNIYAQFQTENRWKSSHFIYYFLLSKIEFIFPFYQARLEAKKVSNRFKYYYSDQDLFKFIREKYEKANQIKKLYGYLLIFLHRGIPWPFFESIQTFLLAECHEKANRQTILEIITQLDPRNLLYNLELHMQDPNLRYPWLNYDVDFLKKWDVFLAQAKWKHFLTNLINFMIQYEYPEFNEYFRIKGIQMKKRKTQVIRDQHGHITRRLSHQTHDFDILL